MKRFRFRVLLVLCGLAGLWGFGGAHGSRSAFASPGGGEVEAPAVDPEHAAMGTVFRVDDSTGENTISFESRAPLEDIVGTSNRIVGYLVFDPEDPGKGGRGRLTVPVASLRTGIPLRDQHLLGEEWLDAAAHPAISLEITEVKDVKEIQGAEEFRTFGMTAVGAFTLHGRSEAIEVPGRVTYLRETSRTKERTPGNLLAVRAEFEVVLDRYGVRGFEGVVGSKVSETIRVSVSFTASDAVAGGAADPEGGKEGASGR